ncbi:hypothetical protein ACOME3_005517 [Neoechinorhynchus agilis]
MKRILLLILLLLVFHFGISYFYRSNRTINKSVFKRIDKIRLFEAKTYLKNASLSPKKEYNSPEGRYVVIIVSSRRQKVQYQYLTQTIASAHKCLSMLQKINFEIWVVLDGSDGNEVLQGLPSLPYNELLLYIATLRFAASKIDKRKTEALLILEDDVISTFSNWIHVNHLVMRRRIFEENPNLIMVRLFYPEKYCNYSMELHCILELMATIVLVAMVLFKYFGKYFSTFIVLMMVDLFILTGRPRMEKLRYIHSALLRLRLSPGCCTPAILMRPDSGLMLKLAHFMKDSINLSIPKDLVIDKFTQPCSGSLTVEPNLFYHIGYVSTLGTIRSLTEFLNNPAHIF